jgi:hypothetical protein
MRAKNEPTDVSIVADDLRVFAVRKWPTRNHKWRKLELASLLGMTPRRVRSIYEAEETARLRPAEEARIKALIEDSKNSELEEANRDAFEALQARIARLEAIVLSQAAQQNNGAMAGGGHSSFGRRHAHVARAARD